MKRFLTPPILALFGLFALVACGAYQLSEVEKLRVGAAAGDYAARAATRLVGCSGQDSDRDGYVTCDLGDGASIVCSYGAEPGCKRKTAAFHPAPQHPETHMLTSSKTTLRRDARQFEATVKTGETVYRGSLTARSAVTGLAETAKADATLTVVGLATDQVTGDGQARVPYERGCYLVKNDATDPVTAGDIGKTAYVVDDETVSISSDTDARPAAGIVRELDTNGVWLEV